MTVTEDDHLLAARVATEAGRQVDLLAGLRRIGIDEVAHRSGQRYLTVVVCHDSGRLVWAAPGRDRQTVERFLDQLGQERCTQIELVSCDMAGWIAGPIAERLPDAVRCVDEGVRASVFEAGATVVMVSREVGLRSGS